MVAVPAAASPAQAPIASPDKEASILEIIYKMERPEDAFRLLDNYVVSRVIQDKWSKFQPVFIAWTVLHLAMVVWITVYAVFKARVISAWVARNATLAVLSASNSTATAATAGGDPAMTWRAVDDGVKEFVFATALLTALWAALLMAYEVARLWRSRTAKEYFTTLLFHHNGFYRLQLIIFALALLIDAVIFAFW